MTVNKTEQKQMNKLCSQLNSSVSLFSEFQIVWMYERGCFLLRSWALGQDTSQKTQVRPNWPHIPEMQSNQKINV